jgi:hypothetical protein
MFDAAFIEDFRKRFASRQEWNRPEFWPVLTDPKRASQLEWLSLTISQFGESQRHNVLQRLQTNKHFLATYNELAVAALLRESDLTIEYDGNFAWKNGVLTPDLTLRSATGDLVGLVEVWTRFRTTEQRGHEMQWKELRARVGRIPRPVRLLLTDLHHTPSRPPDSGQTRKIAAHLDKWLQQLDTAIGATCEVEGYHFQAVSSLPGLRADVATPSATDWQTADMVRKSINVKVSRYADLASSLGVPLVVVLAAEPVLPLSLDMLREALAGSQVIAIGLDPFTHDPIPSVSIPFHAKDIPAEFHPALSMVGWLEVSIDEPGTLTVFDVQSAAHKLTVPLGEHVIRDGCA